MVRFFLVVHFAQRAEALAPVLRVLKERGLSLRAIAAELAKREVPTANGGKWHALGVRNLLRYAGA